MKLSAGILCVIAGLGNAFAPQSRGKATSSSKLSDIPTKLSFEATFPSWLVENANAASTSLNDLKDFKDTLSSQVSSDSVMMPVNVEETVNKILNSELFHLATTAWHLEAILAFGIGSALLWFVTTPEKFDDAPYEPGTTTYSPEKAAEFYAKRPLQVGKRVLKLAFLTGMFNAGVLFDWLVLGKLLKDEDYTALRRNEPRRAKVALSLCEKLGPTFIKLGQALSIRTDLIPEPYALELRQLQDAVPPFDSDIAREVLKNELGVSDLNLVFSSLSDKPVASASIGQVYKGTLVATGKEVAVKVQRPGILAEIALDLHVLRILTPIQTTLQNAANGAKTSPEDIQAAISLVDEWGRGFVAETDYRLEAENTINFESAMRKRGLDAVCAPPVVTELVRDKILVTEWIEGTRLDRDASPDIPRLCGVAINAYLTMLLDTGVLHCDPHPGNLLRTTDGKLCILDWGMTLDVPPNLQYALLELIAHINIEDYDAIPQDFINLGFSPEGVTADRLKSSGITEGLTFAFRQLSQGGGPKKIQERVKDEFKSRYGSDLSDEELRLAAREDMVQQMQKQLASEGVDVQGVSNIMEEVSKRNRDLFKLPPYVLYVARAFSTLEGIGLSIDENYAIVQECYPYLARRLFTDRSPRAKRALRAMLGLAEDADPEQTLVAMNLMETGNKSGALSPSKLFEMSDGFASYTAATANVDRDGAGQEAAVLEFVKLLVDEEGSTLQDILVEETARLGDAATRSALKAGFVDSAAAKVAANVLRTPRDLLQQSPLVSVFPKFLKEAIVDRPAELPDLIESLLSHNEEDERILSTATELRDILSSRLAAQEDREGERISSPNASLDASAIRELLADEKTRNLILEQVPGFAALGRRLGAGLLRRAAYRTDRAHALPEDARNQLADMNRRLAKALDVEEKESVDA
ncbi:unnamed protein product [Cylindrotheca closterium]|uniref:ABC1 atypical kinase-like domain-containing protein n=1 Tax=Cylindrotheca closterium TaxID=2856 RepID=A0AAD2CVD8_9STRA|nr:unnamed protein product [Cylindrotheca closterium]